MSYSASQRRAHGQKLREARYLLALKTFDDEHNRRYGTLTGALSATVASATTITVTDEIVMAAYPSMIPTNPNWHRSRKRIIHAFEAAGFIVANREEGVRG